MASREYTDAQLHEGYELNRYTIQPDAEDARIQLFGLIYIGCWCVTLCRVHAKKRDG